jgi:ubiquinone biosynthesis protein Coq4
MHNGNTIQFSIAGKGLKPQTLQQVRQRSIKAFGLKRTGVPVLQLCTIKGNELMKGWLHKAAASRTLAVSIPIHFCMGHYLRSKLRKSTWEGDWYTED